MRALVIDDSRVMRHMLKTILGQVGFECVEAGNGKEGLDVLRQNPGFHVVLCDWHMPEMDGMAFLQSVRADATLPQVPILMVTSDGEAPTAGNLSAEHATHYLPKPFTKELIQAKLQEMGLLQA